jgi:hypothetical protein
MRNTARFLRNVKPRKRPSIRVNSTCAARTQSRMRAEGDILARLE